MQIDFFSQSEAMMNHPRGRSEHMNEAAMSSLEFFYCCLTFFQSNYIREHNNDKIRTAAVIVICHFISFARNACLKKEKMIVFLRND